MARDPKEQQAEGKMDKAKGRAKEAAGDLTDDKDTKAEGKKDRAKGSVKEKAGEAREKVRRNT